MAYNYEEQRPKLFTDEGQRTFIQVRDNVHALLSAAGAFTASKAWDGITADTWLLLACLDRLCELNEITEARHPRSDFAQYRLFVK